MDEDDVLVASSEIRRIPGAEADTEPDVTLPAWIFEQPQRGQESGVLLTERTATAVNVWRRAELAMFRRLARELRDGDHALTALLIAHRAILGQYVPEGETGLFAVAKYVRARAAYRFFGFDDVARLLEQASSFARAGWHTQDEQRFVAIYQRAIDEDRITRRFHEHFTAHPDCYAPIVQEDSQRTL
jgi:hypothetical protein